RVSALSPHTPMKRQPEDFLRRSPPAEFSPKRDASSSDLKKLSVCHIVASLSPTVGGPAESVSGLTTALASEGVEIDLAALHYPHFEKERELPGVRVHLERASILARYARGCELGFEGRVREASRTSDLIHNHGLWM